MELNITLFKNENEKSILSILHQIKNIGHGNIRQELLET